MVHYAWICFSVDNENGELIVSFLQICNDDGTLFKLDATDVSDVTMDQETIKLPVPNLIIKGNVYFTSSKKRLTFLKSNFN